MTDLPGPGDLAERLEAMRRDLDASNPELYRHLALYLQVLRGNLPATVQQAVFHLATQVQPRRYTELPAAARRQLQGRLALLVQRCTSLLTVEQIACLAAAVVAERGRRELQDPLDPMERLRQGGDPVASGPGAGSDSQDQAPPGSVRIDPSPPHSPGLFGWSAPLTAGADLSDAEEAADGEEEHPEPPHSAGPAEAPPGRHPHAGGRLPHPLTSRFVLDGQEPAAGLPAGHPSDAAALMGFLAAAEAPDPSAGTPSVESAGLWLEGRLPREPRSLLRWLDGMELALARRLRNLSHAVNVELLRVGLSQTLLPVALLDAVVTGQLETQSAPPNLLRLQIPLPLPGRGGPLESLAVLVRCADLEMEDPRLRTCRRRLQQHRQDVRRMARDFRRLQRRLQVQQAECLWLQDTRTQPPLRD